MIILAMDTTALVASVAIVDEHRTIAEITVNNKKTHSQMLMPMIAEAFKKAEISPSQLDYIACAGGPGSFTGLRIGIATAKGLAHSLNKPVISVPTLDALAYNIFDVNKIIAPIMDARRGQVYGAIYSGTKRLSEYYALPIDEVLDMVSAYNKEAIFLGDGVYPYKSLILEKSKAFSLAHINMNLQRAASVGAVALSLAAEGQAVDYKELKPFYLRLSQAEREKNNRLPE